jgi:hypothetical protein
MLGANSNQGIGKEKGGPSAFSPTTSTHVLGPLSLDQLSFGEDPNAVSMSVLVKPPKDRTQVTDQALSFNRVLLLGMHGLATVLSLSLIKVCLTTNLFICSS